MAASLLAAGSASCISSPDPGAVDRRLETSASGSTVEIEVDDQELVRLTAVDMMKGAQILLDRLGRSGASRLLQQAINAAQTPPDGIDEQDVQSAV